MTDFSKIGKKSKRKGNAYERKVAKILADFTSVNFRRVPSSGGFNKQGAEIAKEYFCGDLICDSEKFLYCIEAKDRTGFSLSHIIKNPSTADFTEWWFKAVRESREAKLLPLMFIHLIGGRELVAVTNLNHSLSYGIVLEVYEEPISFSVKEKAKGDSKVRKHNVKAKLPVPYLISWGKFIETNNPKNMFGDRSKLMVDYGAIIDYD